MSPTTGTGRRGRLTGITGGRAGLVLGAIVAVVVALLVPAAGAAPATGSLPATTATVTGSVRGDGAPLAGVTVQVVTSLTGRTLAATVTAADGTYAIGGLSPRWVKVRFAADGWLSGYAVGASSFWSATPLRLRAGRTTTVPVQTLVREAVIQGQVLSWMDPLSGATVSVLDADTGRVLKSVHVPGHEYRIGGLAAGRVKVRATAPGYEPDYADDAPSFATARVFELHPGEVLTQGWDPIFLYLDLTPGAPVTGSVLGAGAPLAGVTVSVVQADTGRWLASGTSDALGRYQVDVGWFGTVKVHFAALGWCPSYAVNTTSFPAAAVYLTQPITEVPVPQQTLSRSCAR